MEQRKSGPRGGLSPRRGKLATGRGIGIGGFECNTVTTMPIRLVDKTEGTIGFFTKPDGTQASGSKVARRSGKAQLSTNRIGMVTTSVNTGDFEGRECNMLRYMSVTFSLIADS